MRWAVVRDGIRRELRSFVRDDLKQMVFWYSKPSPIRLVVGLVRLLVLAAVGLWLVGSVIAALANVRAHAPISWWYYGGPALLVVLLVALGVVGGPIVNEWVDWRRAVADVRRRRRAAA